jgi:hypothetical protein
MDAGSTDKRAPDRSELLTKCIAEETPESREGWKQV